MIKGIGLDIIEIERIRDINDRSDKFRLRILTDRELAIYHTYQKNRQLEFLAGRFSAKEAFSKARGTGIGKGCEFLDIEILPNSAGQPILFFQKQEVKGFVSITHSKEYVAAQVLLLE